MPQEGIRQLDGSYQAVGGPRILAHVLLAVDDATGTVPHGIFREREDTHGYFELSLWQITPTMAPASGRIYGSCHSVCRHLRARRLRKSLVSRNLLSTSMGPRPWVLASAKRNSGIRPQPGSWNVPLARVPMGRFRIRAVGEYLSYAPMLIRKDEAPLTCCATSRTPDSFSTLASEMPEDRVAGSVYTGPR